MKQKVLTKFTGPSFPLDIVSKKFVQWLGDFQSGAVLQSDSQHDRDIINALCGYPIPLTNGFKCIWIDQPRFFCAGLNVCGRFFVALLLPPVWPIVLSEVRLVPLMLFWEG